jgi:hypothetical protein
MCLWQHITYKRYIYTINSVDKNNMSNFLKFIKITKECNVLVCDYFWNLPTLIDTNALPENKKKEEKQLRLDDDNFNYDATKVKCI